MHGLFLGQQETFYCAAQAVVLPESCFNVKTTSDRESNIKITSTDSKGTAIGSISIAGLAEGFKVDASKIAISL